MVDGEQVAHFFFGLAVKRGGESIDRPVGHLRELRGDEADGSVKVAQEKICAQRGADKCPDIGADVLGPTAAIGIP